jgi:hypothetical protein
MLAGAPAALNSEASRSAAASICLVPAAGLKMTMICS